MHICPACESDRINELYTLRGVPVHSCILFASQQAARDYTTGDIELAFCHDCGFVFNRTYDPALQEYSENFEESQHFSHTFNRFARTLAETIAREHDLAGRTVLEIGCGKAEFLALLCRIADCRGVGIDPGARPERLPEDVRSRIELIRDFYGPQHARIRSDLVLCRHTLEHIGPVGRFLRSIRESVNTRPHTPVIFETPDALRVLREGAFWDIYYEHCSYFTAGAHARAFRSAGFDITALELQYDGQYIVQTAHSLDHEHRRDDAMLSLLPLEQDLEQVRHAARALPERIAAARQHWRDTLSRARDQRRRIALWGGGSKAVAFTTTLALQDAVEYVIDINPFKQGRFLPGSGIPVLPPDHLVQNPPDLVIAMNPIYRPEIERDLRNRDISCELVAL